MFRCCWLPLPLLSLLALLLTLPVQARPVAAACVIKYQQTLLLVQDRVSSRYSLSGGYIEQDETPQQAALRELFEETGLIGRITGSLGQWQQAALFACQTLVPIRAQQGSGFISLLQAPNLGGEILNARLIDPARLATELRRFPAQLRWLEPRLASVTDSQVQWLADFSAEASLLHKAELPLIRGLQQWFGPEARWLQVSNLFGSATLQLTLLLLLLPLLGWPRLKQLLLAMLTLTLLVQLTKAGLGWPRPFHLDPALAQQSPSGFGMPSGHAATALLFWGGLVQILWPAQPWRAMTLGLLLAASTGLARIWLGVHFPSDVAVGLLLGALMLVLSRRWQGWGSNDRVWIGLILASGLSGWWSQSPPLVALAMFSLGLTLGGRIRLARSRPTPCHGLAATTLGCLPIGALLWYLPHGLTSSWLILTGQWLLYCCLGLWLSAGLWWILSFVKSDPRSSGATTPIRESD